MTKYTDSYVGGAIVVSLDPTLAFDGRIPILAPIPRHCQPRRHLLAKRRSKWKKGTNSLASRSLPTGISTFLGEVDIRRILPCSTSLSTITTSLSYFKMTCRTGLHYTRIWWRWYISSISFAFHTSVGHSPAASAGIESAWSSKPTSESMHSSRRLRLDSQFMLAG